MMNEIKGTIKQLDDSVITINVKETVTYKKLQQRIDKAIEYIDKHMRIDDEYPAYMEMLIEERDDLLRILKGNSNEQ